MAGKRKKAATSRKKSGKIPAGANKPKAIKKNVSASAKLPPDSPLRSRELFIQIRNGSRKVVMEVLKKEDFAASGRHFQIHFLKSAERKRLVFDVYEQTDKELQYLPQLRWELKMTDPSLAPEEVRGFEETLALVKKSIVTYANTILNQLKEALWPQFGASIDMLTRAISAWPDASWKTDKRFFYTAYHALVFLEYYLTDPVSNPRFSAWLPFTFARGKDKIPAEALDDLVPKRIYSKKELMEYAAILRQKCRFVIDSFTESRISERWVEHNSDRNYAWLEILLYNMRHVQHHAAQLNMLLRQKINEAPAWIGRAADQKT